MTIQFGTALIVVALVSSVWLFLQKSDRLFPTIAVIASGIEALLAFGIVSLSVAKFRIDVILPALLVLAGAFCWARSTTKGTITAATLVTLIGAVQLLRALRFFT